MAKRKSEASESLSDLMREGMLHPMTEEAFAFQCGVAIRTLRDAKHRRIRIHQGTAFRIARCLPGLGGVMSDRMRRVMMATCPDGMEPRDIDI